MVRPFSDDPPNTLTSVGIICPGTPTPMTVIGAGRNRASFEQPMLNELDLSAAGIANVIWATSYDFDFSLVRLPIVDAAGYPIQTRRSRPAYSSSAFLGCATPSRA